MVLVDVIRILQNMPGQHRENLFFRLDWPAATSLRIPATVVAEAGSHPIPSRPIIAFASAISCSLTLITCPRDRKTARKLFRQETGAPILIAVASVLRLLHRCPWCLGSSSILVRSALGRGARTSDASGAEPSACTTLNFGKRSIRPMLQHLLESLAERRAVPHIAAGNNDWSGTCQLHCCINSKATVFCPSMRNGLIEFAT